MSGIEQLKRRVDSLAPALEMEYCKSLWDLMSPSEQRAEVRRLIKVWTDHTGEILTEPEIEVAITRIIAEHDGLTYRQKQAGRIAAGRMTDAELESRARGIFTGKPQGS